LRLCAKIFHFHPGEWKRLDERLLRRVIFAAVARQGRRTRQGADSGPANSPGEISLNFVFINKMLEFDRPTQGDIVRRAEGP